MATQIPGLTEEESDLFSSLKQDLFRLQSRNRDLVQFYESERSARSMGIMIPPEFSDLKHILHWPASAVDKVVERLGFDGFVEPGDSAMNKDLLTVFTDNGMEMQQTIANTDSGITGVSFVLTMLDDAQPSGVSIRTYAAHEATGRWNARMQAFDAALVVEEADLFGVRGSWVFYLPDKSVRIEASSGGHEVTAEMENPSGRVMLRPLPFFPRTGKPLGRSLITRPIRSYTEQAVRVTLRTEVQGELYTVPGRAVVGADEDAFVDENGRQMSSWDARIGTIMLLGLNQDTLEKPTIQEFQQATMQPHMEHLRMLAALYTDESGVHTSLATSGVDNPESADAKRESRSQLVSMVEQLQRATTRPWSMVAGDVLTLLNGGVTPEAARGLLPKWWDASAPTKASQSSNVRDLVESGVLPPTSEVTLELLGFDSTTIQRLKADQQAQQSQMMMQAMAASRGAQMPATVRTGVETTNVDR